jgi:hypothetical protein
MLNLNILNVTYENGMPQSSKNLSPALCLVLRCYFGHLRYNNHVLWYILILTLKFSQKLLNSNGTLNTAKKKLD